MSEVVQILFHTAQVIALWAVVVRWSVIKNTTERYFLPYLIYVVLNEIVAKLLTYTSVGNYALYNAYDIITFSFLLFWFYQLLKSRSVLLLGTLYYTALAVSLYKEDFVSTFLNINVYAGTIMVILLAVLYFGSLLQQPEVVEYQKIPAFWITTGLLIFNVGYLPIQFLINSKGFDPTAIYLVLAVLNILCYGCFTKGFLSHRKIPS